MAPPPHGAAIYMVHWGCCWVMCSFTKCALNPPLSLSLLYLNNVDNLTVLLYDLLLFCKHFVCMSIGYTDDTSLFLSYKDILESSIHC